MAMANGRNAVLRSPASSYRPGDRPGLGTPRGGFASPRRLASTRAALCRRILPVALAVLCAGCASHWPEPGQGGMVEARWPGAVATTRAPASLADRLHCTLGRLEALRQTAARTGRFTGQIALLDITATRAKREYAGKLFDDSRITLTELDAGIDDLARDVAPPPISLPVCT
jgi:hypothetical protein